MQVGRVKYVAAILKKHQFCRKSALTEKNNSILIWYDTFIKSSVSVKKIEQKIYMSTQKSGHIQTEWNRFK